MKSFFSLFGPFRRVNIILIAALIVMVTLISAPFQTPVKAAGTNCITSTSPGGIYTVTPCLTTPADGATVSGDQTVSVTVNVVGTNPGISKLIFYLNGQYLITDFQSPYTFVLPTSKFVDGSQSLSVAVTMKDSFISQPPSSITLTFNNGVTTITGNNNPFTPSTGTAPQPGQPFVLAATGDGADGTTFASSVTSMIANWNPNLFLYLGDVYDNGTDAEFSNWYGNSSAFFGLFRPITNPVVGNHEYTNGVAPGYFNYWGKFPNSGTIDYSYYSYDVAGWHFIALNSNCSILLICGVGQQEYQWLQNDLNTHTNICTIAYYHHPVFNTGMEGSTIEMDSIWALLAQSGVDVVLNGHEHDYQRWVPLDANGVPSPSGITEFIAGGGGHGTTQFSPDPRIVTGFDTTPQALGALRLQLNQYGANFQYINIAGTVLDSGVVPCSGAPVDTSAPTAPTNLTATPSSTNANLTWNASTDNVGIANYDLYRNGSLLTSVGPVTSYTDSNLTSGATYQYQVIARDASGNVSNFSNTATALIPILFSDGFESGDFSAWTSNKTTTLLMQQLDVHTGSNAARALSTGTSSSYAYETFSTTQTDLYYNLWFKETSQGNTSAYLQRFRTSTNVAIGGVFINSTGKLAYHNDAASPATTTSSTIGVTQNVWHQLQTHLHINGTTSQIEVWFDGTQVTALSKTDNFGNFPIGRIQAGDMQSTDIYNIAIDDVGVNTSFIGQPNPTPTPTATATLTSTATPTSTATVTPTQTNTSVPGPTNTPTPTSTPTNTPLPGATNTPTATITPTSNSSVLFSDGFESGNFLAWTSGLSTSLSIQQSDVHLGVDASRAASTGSVASYAYETLSTTQSNLYYNLWFKILSQGTTSAYLQRFRTSTNIAIGGVFITSAGKLAYHNDAVSPATTTSSTIGVTQNVWHQLQTHLNINSTSSQIEVWYDGSLVASLSKIDNFGINPIGRIQLGDFSPTDIYNIDFDDISVSTTFIGSPTATPTATNILGPTNTPTATSTPTNTSVATNTPTATPTPTNASSPTNTPTATPLATNTPTPTPTAGSAQVFTPDADSYVDASKPTTNFGTATTLRVDSSPVVASYLRFTVQGLVGSSISQVHLLIYANSSSSTGITAFTVADNTWGEKTITSSNAPAMGSSLGTFLPVATGTWITYDVTSYITGQGTYSFGLSTSGATAISLASRESGAHPSQLIVTMNP